MSPAPPPPARPPPARPPPLARPPPPPGQTPPLQKTAWLMEDKEDQEELINKEELMTLTPLQRCKGLRTAGALSTASRCVSCSVGRKDRTSVAAGRHLGREVPKYLQQSDAHLTLWKTVRTSPIDLHRSWQIFSCGPKFTQMDQGPKVDLAVVAEVTSQNISSGPRKSSGLETLSSCKQWFQNGPQSG